MQKKLCAMIAVLLMIISICASNVSASIVGYVTASALNIRQAPGTTASVLAVAPNGAALNVLSTDSAWYSVEYNGVVGYVYSCYLSLSSTQGETAQSSYDPHQGQAAPGISVVEYSKNFIGVPYSYGGNGPYSFDCSGFVKYVYANYGVSLPRTSYAMMNCGTAVSTAALQPGDLLFFRGGGHVGIYVGNNSYIHAPQTGRTVSIDPIQRDIYAARRIF